MRIGEKEFPETDHTHTVEQLQIDRDVIVLRELPHQWGERLVVREKIHTVVSSLAVRRPSRDEYPADRREDEHHQDGVGID